MTSRRPQIKLFVIMAREAETAIILRRGPSRWYHLIEWNTRRDLFTNGAWFKGRIYEEKCDLSPNGRLFVYSALQGSRAGTAFTHAWTAVSRVPWLSAIALWPMGTTYGGGGRFVDDKTVGIGILPQLAPTQTHRDFPVRNLKFAFHTLPPLKRETEVPDADWSGRDQNGRVVFTLAGRLLERVKKIERTIADFTELTPAPQEAPEWAKRPF